MNNADRTALSKLMSHALRHAPQVYGLELDDDGWVDVSTLAESLRSASDAATSEAMVVEVVRTSPKNRFELAGRRVRARYGHSFDDREIVKERIVPPVVLFHATDPANAARIAIDGLLPMGRHYVHLAVTEDLALEAGRRKVRVPMLYRVSALEAHDAGVPFYFGNDHVHLAGTVPARFLEMAGA